MEPTRPEHIERILRDKPHVKREHFSEYHRLLIERQNINPNVKLTKIQLAALDNLNVRIKKLYFMIFK